MRHVIVKSGDVVTNGIIINGELFISPLPISDEPNQQYKAALAEVIKNIPTPQQEGENALANVQLNNRKRALDVDILGLETQEASNDVLLKNAKKMQADKSTPAHEKAQYGNEVQRLKNVKNDIDKKLLPLRNQLAGIIEQLDLVPDANMTIDITDILK